MCFFFVMLRMVCPCRFSVPVVESAASAALPAAVVGPREVVGAEAVGHHVLAVGQRIAAACNANKHCHNVRK